MLRHKVLWDDLVPNHDNKAMMKKVKTGNIIDSTWVGPELYCAIVEREGKITIKKATDLIVTNPPPST